MHAGREVGDDAALSARGIHHLLLFSKLPNTEPCREGVVKHANYVIVLLMPIGCKCRGSFYLIERGSSSRLS